MGATDRRRRTEFGRQVLAGDEEVWSALRELIVAVIVHPAEKDEPRIEVRGRLAQLTGAPELFPQQEISPQR